MPRPIKCRKVCRLPKNDVFGPENPNLQDVIIMSVEEYETIRLIDYENFTQEQCSVYMGIARTTVQQLYNNARKKISVSLVDGVRLKIEGGNYRLCDDSQNQCHCRRCHKHKQNERGDI